MKKTKLKCGMVIILTILYACQPKNKSALEYVDPTIGNVGLLLQPTRPTVQLPNQMTRMYPDRKSYMDDQISKFPLNVISHRIASAFNIKPVSGEMQESNWNKRMTYDHDLEVTRPWYYSTYLIDDEIKVEYTVGAKTGIFRFDFNGHNPKNILLGHYYGGGNYQVDGNAITGVEVFKNVKVYLYARLTGNPKISKSGDDKLSATYHAESNHIIEFSYATSFISVDQAKKNYTAELENTDFNQLMKKGKAEWAKVIDQIEVEGGTEAQKRSFYTALYRCYERMTNISEDGKYFSGFDDSIHTDSRPFYVDDWVWDTYLAHHPLRAILNPDMESDILQSYVRMYEQSGWMPTFPVIYGDHACMNGFHSTIMFLDDYRKGIENVDYNKAFEGMLKNAEFATMLPWRNGPKCKLDNLYNQLGYYPALHPGENETEPLVHGFEKRQAVAITLGHSYDDWALAQMADELHNPDVNKKYLERSKDYVNLWNKDKQMFMPKDSAGNWIDIDPKFDGGMGGRDFYDENNGYTYKWQVQHDIDNLAQLMGGKEGFESELDQLFREGLGRSRYSYWAKFPDATGNVGQFSMGNEPSFHIPYLFNYTKSPWKTQKWTRFLLDTWFKDNVFGIPGDEDGGGMSAFVVFSSMGFYPVTPGNPEYTITSPLFSKVTIHIKNGIDFTVLAKNVSKRNKYIQSAWLNGEELTKPFFSHKQLMEGGVLELEMGELPNKALWSE